MPRERPTVLKSPTVQPVVVVGAGISGLAAALKLGNLGVPAVVLEARDRIGGRILTLHHKQTGAPIELGAEFIHGLPPEIWEQLPASDIEEVQGQPWCRNGQLSPCSL